MSSLQSMIEMNQHIGAVYDTVHEGGHDKGGKHIKNGMLFD